jgi:hypothetical protein
MQCIMFDRLLHYVLYQVLHNDFCIGILQQAARLAMLYGGYGLYGLADWL